MACVFIEFRICGIKRNFTTPILCIKLGIIYLEFIQDLLVRVASKSFNNFNAPRVAQLSQRSNQFNLRTIRYTEKDIIKMKDFEFELPLYAIKMKLAFHPEDEMKNKIESLFN